MPPPISLCMIVRDEADLLAIAIRSARKVVREVIVVDTGSTDATPEIAQRMGASVSHTPWSDDFSAARNAAIARASQPWVLILDADEELLSRGHKAIERAVRTNSQVFAVQIVHVSNERPGVALPSWRPSLFRNLPALRFYGRVHEELQSNGRRGVPIVNLPGGPHVRHTGYTDERLQERHKDERNLALLMRQLADTPGDVYVMLLLARHHLAAGRPAEARMWLNQLHLADTSQLQPHERDWYAWCQSQV
jgi:glycosyltransferase involved in cell wall biosynthesis